MDRSRGYEARGGGVEVRLRGRSTRGAPDGVGSYVRAHGSGLRSCKPYGRPVVEEVRGATEGESIVGGLFKSPRRFREICPPGDAMGEYVKQAWCLICGSCGFDCFFGGWAVIQFFFRN